MPHFFIVAWTFNLIGDPLHNNAILTATELQTWEVWISTDDKLLFLPKRHEYSESGRVNYLYIYLFTVSCVFQNRTLIWIWTLMYKAS